MKTKTNRKIIVAAILFAVLILALILCYKKFVPGTSAGGKTISVEVIHGDGNKSDFTYQTDAEYLGDVLVGEGLVEGSESVKAVREAGYRISVEPKDIIIQAKIPYPARIAFCIGPVGEEIEFFCEK